MKAVLDNMITGCSKETRLSYTREWVETQSRGGLTLINDSTFLFFEEIEKLLRQKFPQSTSELRGRDLREGITESVLTSRTFLDKWTLITAHSSLSGLTLLPILYYYITGIFLLKNYGQRKQEEVFSLSNLISFFLNMFKS